MAEETFNVWLPNLSIEKAKDGKGFKIGGIVSSDRKDIEEENVLQNGLDWTYFLKHGFFRWKHTPKDGPDDPKYATVGKPNRISPAALPGGIKATRVDGMLYDTTTGREIFEAQQAMEKAGDRGYGFSVEGSILKRTGKDGKTIAKATVRNVAIDPHPVNTDARMEAFVRAMKDTSDEDPDDTEEEIEDEGLVVEGEEDLEGLEESLTSESIQPIAPESLEGKDTTSTPRGRRRKQKPLKEDLMKDLQEQIGDLSTEDREKLLASFAPQNGGGEDEVRKALDVQSATLEGLAKAVGVHTTELPSAAHDLQASLTDVSGGVADIRDTQDAQAEATIGIGELVKSLTGAFFDLRDKMEEIAGAVTAQAEKTEEMTKALAAPQAHLQKGVTSLDQVITPPGEQAAPEGDFLNKAQANAELMKALYKANELGNTDRARQLADAIGQIDAGHGVVSAAQVRILTGVEG